MNELRLVGGRWGGQKITTAFGREVTRPTTQRIREQISSMILSLFSLDLSKLSLLDAFAGSGALGFELLSRGAAHCTFVDKDRRACTCLAENQKKLRAEALSDVICADVCRLAQRGKIAGAPFDLILMDPPYAINSTLVDEFLNSCKRGALIVPNAYLLYEHSAKSSQLSANYLSLIKSKTHGITAIDLYHFKTEE